jgi:hypothetical protein
MTTADIKARTAQAWRAVAAATPPDQWPEMILVADERIVKNLPPGYTALRAAVTGSVAAIVPDIVDDAPPDMLRRWMMYAAAASLGECRACGAVASLSHDPSHPANFWLNDVVIRIPHRPGCPAIITVEERRFFRLWAGEQS